MISGCANLSDIGCSGKAAEFQVGGFEQELVPVLQQSSHQAGIFCSLCLFCSANGCICLMFLSQAFGKSQVHIQNKI